MTRERTHDERRLHRAVKDNNTNLVDQLLRAGVDPNKSSENTENWTLLHEAAKTASPEMLEALVGRGIAVDTPSYSGAPPTFWAAEALREDNIRKLVELGADINVRNDDGQHIVGKLLIALKNAKNNHLPPDARHRAQACVDFVAEAGFQMGDASDPNSIAAKIAAAGLTVPNQSMKRTDDMPLPPEADDCPFRYFR
jgi:ankyrin repeat protein